jgi:hypothetical protein
LTSQKEFDKAVEKMKDFNNNNTTIVFVKKIFGCTGKLKLLLIKYLFATLGK